MRFHDIRGVICLFFFVHLQLKKCFPSKQLTFVLSVLSLEVASGTYIYIILSVKTVSDSWCRTHFSAATLLFLVERSSAAHWDLVDFCFSSYCFPLHIPREWKQPEMQWTGCTHTGTVHTRIYRRLGTHRNNTRFGAGCTLAAVLRTCSSRTHALAKISHRVCLFQI